MFGTRYSPELERAVRSVDRAQFLPPDQLEAVNDDRPLPIGHGQTISQPSLVEEMTHHLGVTGGSRVLEIGTGCGYQTAILAHLAREVYTIERIPELAEAARERLLRLGLTNIRYRVGDGTKGWPEQAPFDRIMVTAAPINIPPVLIEQLVRGGRMVIPVGPDIHSQSLWLATKDLTGHVRCEELFGVRFVPLIPDES